MFESAAARFADRIAIEVHRTGTLDSWSYRELHDAAVDRALRLIAAGVTHRDRCAILADNDADWCATYLAILHIGAVAVPLDTSYSAVQLATIVRACAPRVLFANARLAQLARDASAGIPATVVADIRMPQSIGSPGLGDLDGGTSHDPAVILYTAGTTADAKGVVLTHDNLLAARDAACQVVAVEQNDRVLGGLPLFAPLGQLANLLLPCAVGARILFLETTNSNELMRALSDQRITVVTCAPKLIDLLHQRVLRRDHSGMWRTLMFQGRLALNFHSRQLGMNLGPLLFARSRAGMGRHMRLFVTSGSKVDPAVGRDLLRPGLHHSASVWADRNVRGGHRDGPE